ncbi:MAG: DUF1127 domain-containing protein [Paracoccaceae bacterium]|nr:MAG: DUF1127 domain-containing protein [Paracoccaceae bacterium]
MILASRHPAQSRPMPPLAAVLFRVAQVVAGWEERRATRRALSQLDPHMLRDIGLTPEARTAEADKPFWQP